MGGVANLGCEKRQRVVAPVVAQPFLHQVAIIDMVMNGHDFDCRHVEIQQMADRGLRGQARIGPLQILRDLRKPLGETLDVQLID